MLVQTFNPNGLKTISVDPLIFESVIHLTLTHLKTHRGNHLSCFIAFTLTIDDMQHCLSHCLKSVQICSFFWSVFFRIQTAYEEIRGISRYSVRMRKNTDQKKLRIWTLFRHITQVWNTKMMSVQSLFKGVYGLQVIKLTFDSQGSYKMQNIHC